MHDLRHSFAVGALLRQYRAGVDPAVRLPQLSTLLEAGVEVNVIRGWLGHADYDREHVLP